MMPIIWDNHALKLTWIPQRLTQWTTTRKKH